MGNVLLMIPAGLAPGRAIDLAIDLARRRSAEMIGLTVLDPAQPARVASTLDSAFVGERVSDRVIEILAREQRTRAEELLGTASTRAREAGISFRARVEEGDPIETCARVVHEEDVDTAVLVAEKRSWLTRLLSRSSGVRLPSLAGCEVHVVEEE